MLTYSSKLRADQLQAEWQRQLQQQPQQHHRAHAALLVVSKSAPAAASGTLQTHYPVQQAALDTAATLPCMGQTQFGANSRCMCVISAREPCYSLREGHASLCIVPILTACDQSNVDCTLS